MKEKVAIIGCGIQGENHVRVLDKLKNDYNLKPPTFSRTSLPVIREELNRRKLQQEEYVYDGRAAASLKISETNRRLKEKIGYELTGYASYKKMIKKEMPDIAIISSPDADHLKNIDYCIRKGVKKIYCEKPFATAYQVKEARQILKKIRDNEVYFGLNLQLIAIKEALWDKKIFYNLTYDDIAKSAKNFDVEWASMQKNEQNALDSIETLTDLGPHAFSLIPYIDLKQIRLDEGEKDVTIKFLNGKINLSRKETREEANKSRKWSFDTDIGNHRFEYAWRDGKCFIIHFYNDNLHDSYEIEDPLSSSMRHFLKGDALVGAKKALDNLYTLEAVVKSHKFYNIAKKTYENEYKWLLDKFGGKQTCDSFFSRYWLRLNAALKDEEVKEKCDQRTLEKVIKLSPIPNRRQIIYLSSKINEENNKDELFNYTKHYLLDIINSKKYNTSTA